jgi:hypothetical protein
MVRAFRFVSAIVLFAVAGCDGGPSRRPSSPSPAPVLTSMTPSQAAVGDSITLKGSGFAAKDNGIKIGSGYLNGVASTGAASLTFILPSALSACPPGTEVCIALAIPVTPGAYQVAVVNTDGTSNTLPLQVVAH